MLFHRVDDVGEDKYCDIEMIEALEAACVPYILAIVPTWLSPAMARRIQRYKHCTVFQHGFKHHSAVSSGYPDEFPAGLGAEARERLRQGIPAAEALRTTLELTGPAICVSAGT